MSFVSEHENWLNHHLARRTGERLDALRRGHGYGNRLFVEKVWWGLVGHFLGLHPEYEVRDWQGRSYFVDFMWRVGDVRIVFEIMDYGSHGTDRTKYRRDLNRGLFLQSQDYILYYIALDELKENPGLVQSFLRSMLAPYLTAMNARTGAIRRLYSRTERDLMQLAIRHNRVIRPTQAAKELELHKITVIKICRELVDKGKLRAVTRGVAGRVMYYEYIGSIQSPDLV